VEVGEWRSLKVGASKVEVLRPILKIMSAILFSTLGPRLEYTIAKYIFKCCPSKDYSKFSKVVYCCSNHVIRERPN
jgi:hypothetical protein